MPPPSPRRQQDPASVVGTPRRQHISGNATSRLEGKAAKMGRQSAHAPVPVPMPVPAKIVHYTLLIKLPFARGDFEDPPRVEWDASRDRKLWKIISNKSKSSDIDWALHAEEFGVTQSFLLQQAAWLYERHFQHVKAQMSKLRTSNAASPAIGTSSHPHGISGGVAMTRGGSGGRGGASRAPSALSIRSKESTLPRIDTSVHTSPRPALTSRTPSANTVTQSRNFAAPGSPMKSVQRSGRGPAGAPTMLAKRDPTTATTAQSSSPPASDTDSYTSSSAEDEPPIRQSQMLRRPRSSTSQKQKGKGKAKMPQTGLSNVIDAGEDSDTSSPTFLPFAVAGGGEGRLLEDPSATLRGQSAAPAKHLRMGRNLAGRTTGRDADSDAADVDTGSSTNGRTDTDAEAKTQNAKGKERLSPTSSTSTSSLMNPAAPSISSSTALAPHRRVEVLSPRHRAELARLGLSPRSSGSGARDGPGTGTGTREGSEGTPSMGSSFSDLDDTSITQSALEEALASNLRHGGASRLSSISHAFGSRLYGRGGWHG